uniref:Uncharacterized protein n=2 Tax=Amphimedon queenslandica TaxID=400682 RepID=A0A1X7TZ77_AMPQE
MLSSPNTYNVIRDFGMLILPSQRTLRDYSNWCKQQLGYQSETFTQLLQDYRISELNEAQKHIALIFDEMKIREGLVFDSTEGNIIGYTDTGDINEKLKKFKAKLLGDVKAESEVVATHMLAICVQGIFFNLNYPIGQFSTTTISGQELYHIVWSAVRRLKEIGLEVVLVVADGIGNNRTFFKLHKEDYMKGGVVYTETKNIYNPSKYIWFMSDICHLIKTTRNCWENSSKKATRHLQINGRHILWKHLIDLYEWSREGSGLYVGNKLKLEHVKLTSYSRMNVGLAAQVLSKSVADMFKTLRKSKEKQDTSIYDDTTETEKFCRYFNYLFDCLNTRQLYEAEDKRNDAMLPYKSKDDLRLKWLANDFLTYLESWQNYAQTRTDLSRDERNKLTLSHQTIEGLKITVYSFLELIPFLLSLQGAKFVLSEKFNQDGVEIFFAKQRARCGRGDNPTAKQFMHNTQAIRTTKSLSFGSSSNIRKRKLSLNVDELSQPIRKKARNK